VVDRSVEAFTDKNLGFVDTLLKKRERASER
jgi:hypothetical protein